MDRELLDQAVYCKDRDAIVVLYYLPDNIYTPYVTWVANKREPKSTFWGHYFETLEDAQEDFDKRSFKSEIELHDVVSALGGSHGDYVELLKKYRGF